MESPPAKQLPAARSPVITEAPSSMSCCHCERVRRVRKCSPRLRQVVRKQECPAHNQDLQGYLIWCCFTCLPSPVAQDRCRTAGGWIGAVAEGGRFGRRGTGLFGKQYIVVWGWRKETYRPQKVLCCRDVREEEKMVPTGKNWQKKKISIQTHRYPQTTKFSRSFPALDFFQPYAVLLSVPYLIPTRQISQKFDKSPLR